MAYDRDTDGALMRVKLDYVVSDRFEVYTQRQEGFEGFLSGLGTEIGLSCGGRVEVSAYEGDPRSRLDRMLSLYDGSREERRGMLVSIVGSGGDVERFMKEVADAGYGLPQDVHEVADWLHPFQSARGRERARAVAEELEGEYAKHRVPDLLGSVRGYVTYLGRG
jgi:hypothetical protein